MNSPILVGLRGSTAPALPFVGSLTELAGQTAGSTLPARKTAGSRAEASGLSMNRFGFPVAAKPVTPQSVEQVKAFAASFVERCWKGYAKLYPDAFTARGNLSKTTPKLVFVPTQAEFDKIFGTKNATSDMIAFVRTDEPSRVYVHTTNLVKYANQFGPNYVKTTMSHELLHNLTIPVLTRLRNDSSGQSASYTGVKNDLAMTFEFDKTHSPDIKGTFSIQELIVEFGAEHFASKATGLPSLSVSYAPVRATGEKLLQIVGEDVFRKAVLANDPGAYRKVVEAAKVLQGQNTRTDILDEKNKAVAQARAAQAAVPFGTPVTTAALDKMDFRYWREFELFNRLNENYPDQIKNFDFKFLKAVDAYFKRQGAFPDPDVGEASQRAMYVAYRAVWPSLK